MAVQHRQRAIVPHNLQRQHVTVEPSTPSLP
jgi:hypothetical protein